MEDSSLTDSLIGKRQRRVSALSSISDSAKNVREMSDVAYVRYCIGEILFSSRLNLLLLCIPGAAICHALRVNSAIAFSLALVSLCPLAERLGFLTEQVSMHTNETVGGLLNASFGNATELIVSVFALRHGLTRVIQLSLLGSVISNLLLVMGSAFLLGGTRFVKQSYDAELAGNNIYLMALGALGVLAATALEGGAHEDATSKHTLRFSRCSSLGLFLVYLAYLAFQLATHQHEYDAASERTSPADLWPWALEKRKRDLRRARTKARRAAAAAAAAAGGGAGPSAVTVRVVDGLSEDVSEGEDGGDRRGRTAAPLGFSPPQGSTPLRGNSPIAPVSRQLSRAESILTEDLDMSEEEEETAFLTVSAGVVWMACLTLLIAWMSEIVVDTIEEASEKLHVPLPFTSAIVLPIAGNACEHASALLFSWRNRMELALGVAVGSATQISVFVLPFCVLLGWAIRCPLSLNFEGFESVCLFGSIVLVSVVLRDGRAHWLKGSALITAYFILACGFWFRDDREL